MENEILGIHHVTAIGNDPQSNVDFYRDVLGLRLVKKTVNFDDPGTYHLYYGDERGKPGSIMTFFPWPGARRGTRGSGQATVTSFSVPAGSLGWWRQRLAKLGIVVEQPHERFDEEAMVLLDPDGLKLELVAHASAVESPPRRDGPVPDAYAVRGFHSVTLSEQSHEATVALLTDGLGFRPEAELRDRLRFAVGQPPGPGTTVDILRTPDLGRGRISAGTVHHVAWRVAGDAEQRAWRERLTEQGLEVTPILDRNYFRSIYFREPGGVLFEIATDPPGFTTDEPEESLGAELKLPHWLEPQRARIEATLPPLPDE